MKILKFASIFLLGVLAGIGITLASLEADARENH